jgi:hypothetical protein
MMAMLESYETDMMTDTVRRSYCGAQLRTTLGDRVQKTFPSFGAVQGGAINRSDPDSHFSKRSACKRAHQKQLFVGKRDGGFGQAATRLPAAP